MDEQELIHAFRNKPTAEGKPHQQVVRDAAMGVAIAKCIIHRLMSGKGKYAWSHPFKCRFCKYDKDFLDAIHDEYMEWSMWKYRDVEPEDTPNNVGAFMMLPPEEQLRLTTKAQGYVEDKNGKPIGPYEEGAGTEVPDGQSEPVGGRTGDRQRGRGRVGGPQEVQRTSVRRVSGGESETPGPKA